MEIRNAKYSDIEGIRINCEINHPVFGWIPYTADPNDVEEQGRLVHAAIISTNLPIAPFVPPPTPTAEELRAIMPTLTPRQLRRMLLLIDMTEATVDALINSMEDPIAKAAAMIDWKHALAYERTHDLVMTLSIVSGFTHEEVDTMWMYASTI